ncbi:AAA family ATPase [Rhodococcus sp. NPDC058521]|uniref:AAA family ATPase n=1 Tax=Rhodococcus sp. NPDC058521 TaxID=3346536 RepID=UPI00364F72CF
MVVRWPSIARGGEVSVATRESRRGIVIVGPAGVGKTTLARTLASDGGESGDHRTPLWAVGTESSADVPLGAFANLVDIGATDNPETALAGAYASLRAKDATIVVDDADLLDPLSLILVRQLVEDGSIRLIVTVGSGGATTHITETLADGMLPRIELGPFTREQSVQAIEAALEGPLDEVSAEWVWDVSEGNPLYLRHLVEGSWEADLLHLVDGVWQLRAPPVATTALTTLIGSRLRNVTPDALVPRV